MVVAPKCYIIGNGSLLISCAKILLQNGVKIKAVIFTDSEAGLWARKNKITYYTSIDTFHHHIEQVDYIFSIGNPYLLKKKTLNYASQFAINYHDGPLPKYAGVNAAMWAILNNEKTHGIVWHIMEEKVDTGDVLLQETIQIEPHETTSSLNVKCYNQAISSFKQLISQVLNNTVLRIKQDLSKQVYFPLNAKLPFNGYVNWNQCASCIDRFCRALAFTDHLNQIRNAKVKIAGDDFLLEEYKVTNTLSTFQPGTIAETCDDLSVEITTSSVNIRLYSVRDASGKIVSIRKLLMQYNLYKHSILEREFEMDKHHD